MRVVSKVRLYKLQSPIGRGTLLIKKQDWAQLLICVLFLSTHMYKYHVGRVREMMLRNEN